MKNNRLFKTIFTHSVFFLLALPFITYAASNSLNVSLCLQEHSNWCWSASCQCIIFYKGQSPDQCDIANYALDEQVRLPMIEGGTFWSRGREITLTLRRNL